MYFPRPSLLPSFLRELFSKPTLQREPESALVMVDSDEVKAYVEAGKQNAFAATYLFMNSHATQVIHGCKKVLDLGCGPATLLCEIARINPSINFVGVDLSETMIAQGNKHIQDIGLDNVTLVRDDITKLSNFGDHQFDGVMSTVALHHLPTHAHLENCFKQIRRVLQPGGAVFLGDFGRLKNIYSVIQMAYLNSEKDPYLFTLDKERSMRAAFSLQDYKDLTKKYFPAECQVLSTFKVPVFIIVRTLARHIPLPMENYFKESRRKLLPKYCSDLDDLRFFFYLDGLTNDLFDPFIPVVGQIAKLKMLDFAMLSVLRHIHSSRISRAWEMICLGSHILRVYVKYRIEKCIVHRADPEHREKFYQQVADIFVSRVGMMKGPLMKFGQMLSYLPEDLPPIIREALKTLQHKSPALVGPEIRKIVEAELRGPISKLFKEWHDTPIAAGSVSQLHLARLPNDKLVVVKVRYPKILQAIRSDFYLLRMLSPLLRNLWGLSNIRELIDELEDLMLSECDFLQAGKFQEEFRKNFQDDPEIIIPKAYLDYSTSAVLTMDYIEGKSYDEFKKSSTQDEKNKTSVIMWRMAALSLNRFCLYNADPHPGNYIFVDGKVAFIDFGFTKRFSRTFTDLWKKQTLAACEGDLLRFTEINRLLGYEIAGRTFDHQAMFDLYRNLIYNPWQFDREFEFSADFVNQEMRALLNSFRSSSGRLRMPVEFVAILRLLCGQHSILADLNAKANWHRIVYPLIKEISQVPT